MSSSVIIRHHTRYTYDRPVYLSEQHIYLKPSAQSRVPVELYSISVGPGSVNMNWGTDIYGNEYAKAFILGKVSELDIAVELSANLAQANLVIATLDLEAQKRPFIYHSPLKEKLEVYLKTELVYPILEDYLNAIHDLGHTNTLDLVTAIGHKIKNDIFYTRRYEPGVQTAVQTLQKKSGSCRDLSWLAIQIFRQIGIAARFVSGYLVQLNGNHANYVPGDHEVDFHAWAEVYLPGAGWIGLDATSGLFASAGHIPLAMTVTPYEAGPVLGTVDFCESRLDTSMSVVKLDLQESYSPTS